MPDYLFPHPNAGWQYRRKVPKALGDVVNRGVWIKYIKACPRAQALIEARKLAVEHDRLIARCNGLSAADRADIVARGGIQGLQVAADDTAAAFVEAAAIHTDPDDDPIRGEDGILEPPATEQERAEMFRDLARDRKKAAALRAAAAPAKTLLTKWQRGAASPLGDLVTLWERIKAPRGARTAQRTRQAVELLAKVIGNDVGPAQLTQAHIVAFRNAYAHKGVTVQTKNLNSVRAVLAVAVDEGVIPINVAAGIRPRKAGGGKLVHADRKRDPFTAEEMRTILERAEATRWGQTSRSHDDKHEDVLWVLKLLVYTGARLNEICQLRPQDVKEEAGIPLLLIHDEGDRQRIKNAASIRKVPLHPAVASFLDYARKRDNRDRVFAGLAYTKGSGYGGWLSSHFLKFRQEVCGITRPKVALHSIRHAYIDATINVGIPDEVSRAIVGHAGKGVHARYGLGAGLKEVAEAVAKVDLLA